MTDPESLARKRWRPVAKALERRERIDRQLAEARTRANDLRNKLPAAEQQDRERRARAIADGRSEQPSQGEKERVEAALADTKQQVQDLQAAAELLATDLVALRQTSRGSWAKDQAQAVERAKSAVLEAAATLERAVAKCEDELALQTWVAEPIEQPTVDPLGGRMTHNGTISVALAQLRGAVEGLAAGTTPQPAPPPEPGPIEKRLLDKARPGWG